MLYDFLNRKSVTCSAATLNWLTAFAEWRTISSVVENNPDYDALSLQEQLESLVNLGLLIISESAEAKREQDYLASWEMGLPATMLHFATLNMPFMSLEASANTQQVKFQAEGQPQLYWQKPDDAPASLQGPPLHAQDLLHLMARRRSNRTPAARPITRSQIFDCLLAGMGITGFVESTVGLLPLTMTPSGGARNPFEAYVYVRNASDMAPGFYHYAAHAHQLVPIENNGPVSQAAMISKQSWADDMAATVILVARLERTMWKYPDNNAYRVVLIEAGHIAQNIMLAATAHGLTACPTAALAHDIISAHLGLTEITHAPVYALCLAEPGDYDANIAPIPCHPWHSPPTAHPPHQ